jgi:hypothetical protein
MVKAVDVSSVDGKIINIKGWLGYVKGGDKMEEEYVFLDRFGEDNWLYLVACETHEQGEEYLINEMKLKNPKLEYSEKVKKVKGISYPYFVMKAERFHQK